MNEVKGFKVSLSYSEIDKLAWELYGASGGLKEEWTDEWEHYIHTHNGDTVWDDWDEKEDWDNDDYSKATDSDKEEIYNRIIELYEENDR